MLILAHIREQYRLSLDSYGRPRMTEELNELGLQVGQRHVGRLAHPARGRNRPLRIHQRLLQPTAQALGPWLEITCGIRTEGCLT